MTETGPPARPSSHRARLPPNQVVTRALAPLAALLTATYPLLKVGTLGLFPKGQDVDAELTEAAKCWSIQSSLAPSLTDPNAKIVCITGIEKISQPRREPNRRRR